MWKTGLKLLMVLFFKKRLNLVKNDFSEHFHTLKENIALMAESRAGIFKQNFHADIHRMVNSLLGFMLILLFLAGSTLIGLMWLFAIAWNSVYRDTILAIAIILPVLVAIGVFIVIRQSWKKEPLFQQSIKQIEYDWLVFRGGLDSTVDPSDEAKQ